MTATLPAIDLDTFHAMREVLIASLQSQRISWEQFSEDAIADDRHGAALTFEQWCYGIDRALEIVDGESAFLLLRSSLPAA